MTAVAMVDAISVNEYLIPTTGVKRIGAYITGTGGVQWTSEQIADRRSAGQQIVTIDQAPTATGNADVKDCETGAATIDDACQWAAFRIAHGYRACVYINASSLPRLADGLRAKGLWGSVDIWIADWSLNQAQAVAKLGGRIVAVQWASPTTNPKTPVPGTNQTIDLMRVDLSVTLPDWPRPLPGHPATPPVRPSRKLHPKVISAATAAAIAAALAQLQHAHTLEGAAVTALAALLAGYAKKA